MKKRDTGEAQLSERIQMMGHVKQGRPRVKSLNESKEKESPKTKRKCYNYDK